MFDDNWMCDDNWMFDDNRWVTIATGIGLSTAGFCQHSPTARAYKSFRIFPKLTSSRHYRLVFDDSEYGRI